jgi:hypothetical protein
MGINVEIGFFQVVNPNRACFSPVVDSPDSFKSICEKILSKAVTSVESTKFSP